MPQLESGRHVAVGEPGPMEAVTQADETSALNALIATRAFIQDTRDLVELLPGVYFESTTTG